MVTSHNYHMLQYKIITLIQGIVSILNEPYLFSVNILGT